MALHLLPSVHMLPLKRSLALVTYRSGNVPRPFQCMATDKISSNSNITTVRRSANYQPPIWHYDYIQSLTSEYVVNFFLYIDSYGLSLLQVFVTILNLDWQGESCTRRHDKLKGEVRMMFHNKEVDPLEQLELIDILQRLGLSYHFEKEIRRILEGVYMNTNHGICNKEKN
jgi:(-)-alpha-terpineol synthase